MLFHCVEREKGDHLKSCDTHCVGLLEVAGLYLSNGHVVQPGKLTTSVLVEVE